jgi:hypothetical protein
MSARVETTPVRESWRPIVIAIIAAVGLGTLAVGTVRIAFDDDPPAAVTSVQSPLWDAQKLEAMEGRVLAAQVGAQSPLWDAQKLEAMEGRVLAAQVATAGTVVPALEPGELKAILEGHGAVTQVGDGDSIVPHVPRRTPRE